MSRSYRHTPCIGITSSPSEKDDKKIWHAKYRQAVRNALRRGDEIMPDKHDVCDLWNMNKDGKKHFNTWEGAEEWRRKARRK